MTYASAVPMYVVTLPCNHEFRSVTRVVTNMGDTSAFVFSGDEDPEDITWLFCRTCDKNYAVEGWELEEYQTEPRDSAGRRISEIQLATRYNDAQIKDRIAVALLKTQGSVSLPQVVANLGTGPDGKPLAALRTVESVAADLRALSKYPAAEGNPVRTLRPAAKPVSAAA